MRRTRAQFYAAASASPPAPSLIAPGGSWNGTAGSGYGVAPTQSGTAVKVQPYAGTMHGTKAANLNWLFTENVFPEALFTDDVTVLLDGGDFDDALSVAIYCEGNSVTLTDRLLVNLPVCTGYDGSGNPTYGTRQIAAYAVTLDHSAFSGSGAIDLYATATSARGGISARTIGPLRLYRKTDLGDGKLGYDVQKTIGGGGDYATLQAALAAHAAWWTSGQCARLKFLNALDVDPAATAFTNVASATNGKRGHVLVDANAFSVVGKRAGGNPDVWRPLCNGLVFKGVTFDLSNITQLYTEDGTGAGVNDTFRPMLAIRCNIFSGGQYALEGGSATVTNANSATVAALPKLRRELGMLSCYYHDIYSPNQPGYIRTGNFFRRTGGDVVFCDTTNGQSYAFAYNIVEDGSSEDFRTGLDAMTIYYTGAGTPGVRFTGTHNAAGRTMILTVNGADSISIPISTTFGTPPYTITEIAASISGNANWFAAAVSNTRRAAALGPETSTAISNVGTSVGTATTLQTFFYIHMDGCQQDSSNNHENHLVVGNQFRGVTCQTLFWSIQTTTKSSYNCIFRNNVAMMNQAGDYEGANDTLESQIAGDHFHLMVDHNTLANQNFLIRQDLADTDLDADCSIRNNLVKRLKGTSVTAGNTNLAFVQGNVALMTTATAVVGANTSGNIVAVADAPLTEFPAVSSAPSALTLASFSPVGGGQARANPQVKAVQRDISGKVRAANDLTGAIAA